MWIEESRKISKINKFFEEKHELMEIRREFELMELKANEIYNEPSIIVIGPFEIELGKELKLKMHFDVITCNFFYNNNNIY